MNKQKRIKKRKVLKTISHSAVPKSQGYFFSDSVKIIFFAKFGQKFCRVSSVLAFFGKNIQKF